MADCVRVALEHVEHRLLESLGGFSVEVAVVRVGGRGQETEATPPGLLSECQQTRKRRLGDDGEVDVLRGVLGGAVELVEQRGA